MSAYNFTAEDFTEAMMKSLPDGPAWDNAKIPGSNLYNVFLALSKTYADYQERANNLLVDGFPSTTVELLTEWESSLGLPDTCQGLAPTISQRQNQVVARFAGSGGQSIAFIIQYASNLGFEITITEFAPPWANSANVFSPICYDSNTIRINAPGTTISYFTVGASVAGDPLVSNTANDVLECEIRNIIAGQILVYFSYT